MIKLHDILDNVKDKCRVELMDTKVINEDMELDVLDEKTTKEVVELFKILSNPIRIKIIHLLKQHDMPVCLLTLLLGVDQTLVSHHLATLKKAGIVEVKTAKKFRIYSLNRDQVKRMMARIFILE